MKFLHLTKILDKQIFYDILLIFEKIPNFPVTSNLKM